MTFHELAGTVSLWLYMLWYTWRLLHRSIEHSQEHSPMPYVWGLLVAACGVFTMRIEVLQQALDLLIANRMPLGQGLRSIFTILAAWCYLLLLWHIQQRSPQIMSPTIKRLYPYLRAVPPLVIMAIVFLLLLSVVEFLSYGRVYYLVILSVDSVALPLIFFVYFPVTLRMARLETVPEMRVKQVATLLLCLLYASMALLFFPPNIVAAIKGEMRLHDSKEIIVIAAVGCIMLQFAPFKVINLFLLPLSYARYWQLLRLEQQVATLTAAVSRGAIWVKPAELEKAHYLALISLLDNAPALPDNPAGKKLRYRIDQRLHEQRDYPALPQTPLEQQS